MSKEQRLKVALLEASPDLLAYFRRRVAPQDAPDLLGEVLVTAWRCVRDVPVPAEEARMWLFGVARGALRNYERGDRRRWALADRIRDHAPTAHAPAADTGIEIRDAISRLPSDLAEVVALVHWEGMSLAEAAQIVGVPASTARGRYQRAKDLLREALSVSTAPISTDAES
ncbi:RNA polymerase sigma factor [Microbacterium sp. P07]|uniref:RNA polymerase sigma factor n=1 Tax=Microbacterium sp. P07 TaxID=3366952 RepID=UPI003746EFA8